MMRLNSFRQFLLGLLVMVTLLISGAAMPLEGFGSSAYAQAAGELVSDEFVGALAPYGEWRRHPRWGEIWVPYGRERDWRPYTSGRWVNTEEWGWYWVSDDEEADWGWVAYHYGRWVHEHRIGWFWVPGNEWAPAWVDWRRGDDYLGWAPMPPEPLIDSDEYVENPSYWIFVEPRYLTSQRVYTYILPPHRVLPIFRTTVVVNRTVRFDREHRRVAVNPGIAPAIVAALGHNSIPTYRVQPHVFHSTQGVAGAIVVRPEQRGERREHRFHTEIQPTTVLVRPVTSVPKAEPLHKGERGRLGAYPPHAAHEAVSGPAATSAPAGGPMRQFPPPQPRTVPEQQPNQNHQHGGQNSPTGVVTPKPPVTTQAPPAQSRPGPAQHGDPNRPHEEHSPSGAMAPKLPVTQAAPPARQIASPPAAPPRTMPAPAVAPHGIVQPAHAPAVHPQPVVHQPPPAPHEQRPPAVQARPSGPPPAARNSGNQRPESNNQQARPHKPGEKPEQQK